MSGASDTEVGVEPVHEGEVPRADPLGHRILRGTVQTLVGYGAGQILRLGGNLVLTRLLVPEAFGVMALVNVFLQGLVLFSDVGLSVAILQHPRGNERVFLRTVWTMQMIRGLLLFLLATALAYPVAAFYENPDLVRYFQVSALGLLAISTQSTNVWLCNRNLDLGRLTIVDIASQGAGMVVMLLWAWQYRTVWALVAGGITVRVVESILSETLIPGPRMRFAWDKKIAWEVFHFGKWILLGTAMTFSIRQVDKIVLGKMMTLDQLGVYGIAFALSGMALHMIEHLGGVVLLPAFSRILESGDVSSQRKRMLKLRGLYCAGALPIALGMMFLGQVLIGIMYDPRYQDAGWMLQIMSIGTGYSVITTTMSPLLLAKGNSRAHMITRTAQLVVLVSLMAVLGYRFGIMGVLWAGVLAKLLEYPILQLGIWKYRLSHFALDIPLLLLVSASGMVIFMAGHSL